MMDCGMTEEKGIRTHHKRCPHGKRKCYCEECGGKGICCHGKQKQFCKDCDSSALRGRGKQKRHYCIDCGGRGLCKTPHFTTRKDRKYKGYCFCYFVQLFPTERVARDYRTRRRPLW